MRRWNVSMMVLFTATMAVGVALSHANSRVWTNETLARPVGNQLAGGGGAYLCRHRRRHRTLLGKQPPGATRDRDDDVQFAPGASAQPE